MSQLRTAGDLRGFLADVLVGIRDGTVDAAQATSISKVAAQINQSLATEVQARIHLRELGGEPAGTMVVATRSEEVLPKLGHTAIDHGEPDQASETEPGPPPVTASPKRVMNGASTSAPVRSVGDRTWCDQCEMRVTTAQAAGCKSKFCKARELA